MNQGGISEVVVTDVSSFCSANDILSSHTVDDELNPAVHEAEQTLRSQSCITFLFPPYLNYVLYPFLDGRKTKFNCFAG